MADIITMGEIIVEIMRASVDEPLDRAGTFRGPFPSGAPAIFIDTAARLGHTAKIIGGVGDDDFGKCLLGRLSGDGVDVSDVIVNGRISTGCAFVTYFEDGSRKFIFHIGNTPAVLAPAPAPEKLAGAKYFHVMGCSMMADLSFGRRIVDSMVAANEQGAKVSFDPNIRPELMKDPEAMDLVKAVVDRMNVFMPGVGELLQFSGKDNIDEAVAHYFENPNLELIVLKDGSRGCHIYDRTGKVFSFGVYKAKPVDATGAGDSFDAAFLCGLIEGKSIEDATKMATAAATLNIAAFGPMEGKINRKNVEAIIAENNVQ